MTERAGHPARRETREEIVARVVREQEALHPVAAYDEAARRRVRRYLYAIWPAGIVVGLVAMWAVGWSWIEGFGFGVAFAVALWYMGIVVLTERDDGRVHRQVRDLVASRRTR
ncbi:hypothetical protein [Miltoncostaea marina]|uniref:hypothetical protein n=1 Tax=Miltoncostaea marina TaxID=2843215 RepID=UPI001C3C1D22|nr:hypothetical protein [Miltoncostaea marina]